ncbi:MAG TPA: DUF4244 domain-containing protein [Pseudonocardiaceae bacterium]|nr:DUF4244 domain-containing protein [Pseudonocardiaceae bacterium]
MLWQRVRWADPWARRGAMLGPDAGMSTAEYAVGTIAAAAFAAVLYAVVTGNSVVSGLSALVQRAMSVKLG